MLAFKLDDIESRDAQLHANFRTFMQDQFEAGRSVMLIVDEAQHLSPPTLEQLRMLTNPEVDSEAALQLILVGQAALQQTLNHPDLNQLRQRMIANVHLQALDMEETAAYVNHRLRAAGAERRIFSDEALAAIYRGSRGVPRMINLVCDMALLYGYAEELSEIDEAVVAQVMVDRGLGRGDVAILPRRSPPALLPHARGNTDLQQEVDREIARQVFGMSGTKK